MNPVLHSSLRHDWETPPELFAELERTYGPFTLDPAATHQTAKAPAYFTPEEDGLAQPWSGRVFLNPPYGREIGKWVAKAARERERAEIIVILIPARTDTRWWHDYIQDKAEVTFLRGRVRFLLDGQRLASAPFPSAVVVYR